jgi:hypothetical protein
MDNPVGRRWTFTLFPGQMVLPEQQWLELPDKFRYLVWQIERSPESGRRHLQGYFELSGPCRRRALQRILGFPGGHLEVARGSRDQNISYCQKTSSRERGPWELGDAGRGGQGKRNDLTNAVDLVVQTGSSRRVAFDLPETYVRFHRGLDRLAFVHNQEHAMSFRRLHVEVFVGAAGTGKTRTAWETALSSGGGYIINQPSGQVLWWDGYGGEDVVIIDDFYGWVRYGYLLKVLDGYPLRLEKKGGHLWASWTRVFITSNKEPESWYEAGVTDALRRRICKYVVFDRTDPITVVRRGVEGWCECTCGRGSTSES